MSDVLKELKQETISMLEGYVARGILELKNVELLTKLINNAENTEEVLAISALGTTYKRTGLHFDKRLEKMGSDVKFFKKNEELSFVTDENSLTHKLIIGDNYDALLNLLITHKRSIDVIYIDPPYGKDSMGDFADTNYDNAITRDNLLSMLYPRLLLAKQLMTDDGLIFISIDDKNYAYIKCLLDEIFGESCFINTFVWQKNSSGKTEKTKFTVNSEYVLLYANSKIYILNDTYKTLAPSTVKMYKRDDNDGRGKYRPIPMNKPDNPGPETTFDYTDNNGKVWKCPAKGWRLKESGIRALENDNRLILDMPTLNEKGYWKERKSEGKRIDTLWTDLPENSQGSKELESIIGKNEFANPKPPALIQRCIEISHKDAIVLDFFAGSGTTGQAVLELNKKDGGARQFILCTNNETKDGKIAYNVTSKRLKRVMTGSCYDGTNNFKWLEKNKSYGDNLEVVEIAKLPNTDKELINSIDESLYELGKFKDVKDKIQWVCENFDKTQKVIESDLDWDNRVNN